MLDDASDYKYVTPPQGMRIDGGIMPARDVAGDGSWKVLRGEDPFFLAEAIARMSGFRRYCTAGAANVIPVTEEVSGDVWNRGGTSSTQCIVKGLMDVANYGGSQYVFTDQPTSAGTYKTDVGGNDDMASVLASLDTGAASAPSFSSDTGYTWSGHPLIADNVRKVWYDYRQFGAIVSVGEMGMRIPAGSTYLYERQDWNGGAPGSYTSTYRDEQEVASSQSLISGSNVFAEVQGLGATASTHSWSLLSVLPYDGAYRTSSPLSVLSGMSATVIFRITVGTLGQNQSMTYAYDSLACAGTVDADGIVNLNNVTASGILNEVKVHRTIPTVAEMLSDSPPYGSAYYGCNVSVKAIGAVFYDSELDTSGINWTWTPPT